MSGVPEVWSEGVYGSKNTCGGRKVPMEGWRGTGGRVKVWRGSGGGVKG